MRFQPLCKSLLGLICVFTAPLWALGDREPLPEGDAPVEREIHHPEWFKNSFLDLRDELQQAREAGKKGVVLYFGQENCAYCKALLEVNLRQPNIETYMRTHFDVIALDIWGSRPVTLADGEVLSERELSLFENTNFTPSLLFYDLDGRRIHRMRGYYKPYRFQAMLEYIVEGYYHQEGFESYIARADPPPSFDEQELHDSEWFRQPPLILDRRAGAGQKPIMVIFEQGQCHACDQLHSQPLHNERTQELLQQFEAYQLRHGDNMPLITPRGDKTTVAEWGQRLGIHYLPTLLFFSADGDELLRIDSVVGMYRLRGVLDFIASRGHQRYSDYQGWRRYSGRER